jgi:hypothetical protein
MQNYTKKTKQTQNRAKKVEKGPKTAQKRKTELLAHQSITDHSFQ